MFNMLKYMWPFLSKGKNQNEIAAFIKVQSQGFKMILCCKIGQIVVKISWNKDWFCYNYHCIFNHHIIILPVYVNNYLLIWPVTYLVRIRKS